jgi:MFS family permease
MSFGMMGVFFLLPVFLQSVLGYSAIKAGLVMTPLAAVVIISAPVSGTLSDRLGPKWLMFSGTVIAALGFFLTMRAMQPSNSWPSFILPFAVSGFGIGMVMPPMTSAVMGSVAPERAGQASGVISSTRQIGSVLGIAVMGTLLLNRAVAYLQTGIGAKLDASPFPLPAGTKQAILDAVATSASNMGQMAGGSGIGASMPSSVQDMIAQVPASMQQQVIAFFKDLFNPDYIMGEFAHAMRTTYLASIILMLVGAALALFVSGRIKKKKQQ